MKSAANKRNETTREIAAMRNFLRGFDRELDRSFRTPEGRQDFVNTLRTVADLFDQRQATN